MKKCISIFLVGFLILIGLSCSESTEPSEEKSSQYTSGLKASYSTGVNKIESIIFHGYWGDCDETGNNMYEGQCTDVDASPVDWAWGNFSAEWEGYIFIPESGDYRFSSYYWVDGIIYIAINDSVVADLNTPGGGYSKSLSLTGETWYTVSMTFASNGGSNNMHLGWTKPNSEWEIVPAEYLGHRE